MSVERTRLTPDIAEWLDAAADIPAAVAELQGRMAGDEWENMMTHPDLGALLQALVRATGGHRVLEIGTFVGTSALWMATALAPSGHIDCLEADPDRADSAAGNLRAAGFHDQVTIHVGPALDTLPALGPGYDLAYIDADKPSYPAYLRECTRLVRPGGIVVADNIFGASGDADQVAAMRAFAEQAVSDPALVTAIVPVGDGITLSTVR